jgi:hypothetical protein
MAKKQNPKADVIDNCPVCGYRQLLVARCAKNEFICINGHRWRRFVDRSFALIGVKALRNAARILKHG